MCNCFNLVVKALRKEYPGVEINHAFLCREKPVIVAPTLEFEYTPIGKKRKIKKTIIPTYCPFCGNAYKKSTCKGAGKCDHNGSDCDANNNCGECDPI